MKNNRLVFALSICIFILLSGCTNGGEAWTRNRITGLVITRISINQILRYIHRHR